MSINFVPEERFSNYRVDVNYNAEKRIPHPLQNKQPNKNKTKQLKRKEGNRRNRTRHGNRSL